MKGILRFGTAILIVSLFSGFTSESNKIKPEPDKTSSRFENFVDDVYKTARLGENGLAKPAFEKAVTGYYNIKAMNNSRLKLPVLSVIDFTKKSTDKRLWVIDLLNRKLLYNSLVAHGRNTGEQYASHFSNKNSSNMSSIGFYLTGETYIGKHGRSLALDGLEAGFNDHARQRALVVHAADYVSEDFINKVGRLGRSQGCPAVPESLAPQIINAIAHGSCLFIYYPDKNYESSSGLLNTKTASAMFESK